MALVIALVNKSGLAPISEYEAEVYVNETKIAGPFRVKGHERVDGWLKLLEMFVMEAKKENAIPKKRNRR